MSFTARTSRREFLRVVLAVSLMQSSPSMAEFAFGNRATSADFAGARRTDEGLVFYVQGSDEVGKATEPVAQSAGELKGSTLGGLFGSLYGLTGPKNGSVASAVGGVKRQSDAQVWTRDVPGLSWPLPAPSARMVLPKEAGAWAQQRGFKIRDIAAQVQAAMMEAGYSERSFFDVPDGFVLVTRLEQIKQDGTPMRGADRWNVEAPADGDSFLLKVLKGMAGATSGNYRLFIFVLSTDDRAPASEGPSFLDAQVWFLRGAAGLTADTADKPVTARHRMSVLVYEFEATSGQKVLARSLSALTCEAHLEKAGLWNGLSRLARATSPPTRLAHGQVRQ